MKALPPLRRPQDFDRVFSRGRWRRSKAVAVGTYHRDDDGPTRLAFVAGRRIGTAVRRNRARRRMREALRTGINQIMPGADVIIAARDATADVDFRALKSAIRNALGAEGLLGDTEVEDQPR